MYSYEIWPSREIPIKSLEAKLRFINDADEQRAITRQIAKIQHKREYLRNHTTELVKQLIHDKNIQNLMLTRNPPAITKLDCHHNVVQAYNRICFNFGKNPYATAFVKVLTNLCEYGLGSERIIHVLMDHCLDIKHRNIV